MDRSQYLGGTDARHIAEGEWKNVVLEKLGRIQPPDLRGNFNVQLGKATETFHLEWLAEQQNVDITDSTNNIFIKHPLYNFIGGTLDSVLSDGSGFVEVKHSNSFTNYDEQIRKYYPQIQHYFSLSAGWTKCIFSVIFGNNYLGSHEIQRDDEYIKNLLEKEIIVWDWIKNKNVPEQDPEPIPENKKNIILDGMKTVNMEGNNLWAVYSKDLLENKPAKKLYEGAVKGLKELIPSDVREATGHGIKAKRATNNSIRISVIDD